MEGARDIDAIEGREPMKARRIAGAVTLLGSWLLVQVPEKEMKLSDPGHPIAPITTYKKVREYDQYEQCEFARANALQDALNEGSQAMAAQASSLRCMPADQPTPAVPGATP
jgi:hypothetical protein